MKKLSLIFSLALVLLVMPLVLFGPSACANGDGIKSYENGVLTLEPFGCALILL